MFYDADYLRCRRIFTDEQLLHLQRLSEACPFESFIKDHRTFEERSIDYAFVSSKIEGNQYSRKGASLLLKYGFTENGKTYEDATMLVNLRDTFVHVTLPPEEPVDHVLTRRFVRTVHSAVSEKLVDDRERGQVRNRAVTITGADYIPLDNAMDLESEMTVLLERALQIPNPFEAAVYVHCNLAYLQYFIDGNKRVARLMQTAVLAAHKITPLFLREDSIQAYLLAVLEYYQSGSFRAYADLFCREYEHTILALLGKAPEQLEAQALAKKKMEAARSR